MTAVLVTASLAPMMREPSPRAEIVSQILSGETGAVEAEQGDWLRIVRSQDQYQGWVHRGYVRVTSPDEAERWREKATHRSQGARLRGQEGEIIALALLARVAPVGDRWQLASGWLGQIADGSVSPEQTMVRETGTNRPLDWAKEHFYGSPYLWGGITPWGVDCSGLVQTTFAARGRSLPRDAADQANCGLPVSLDQIQSGDLVFFSESGQRITHVAFAGDDETLVHSTLACGGFTVESWRPGSRAARLKEQLVLARRI